MTQDSVPLDAFVEQEMIRLVLKVICFGDLVCFYVIRFKRNWLYFTAHMGGESASLSSHLGIVGIHRTK